MAFKRRSKSRDSDSSDSGAMFLGAAVAHDTTDDEMRLAPEFAELVESFHESVRRYHEGELSSTDLAEILSETKVTDSTGAVWTLGATSGAWYRKSGRFGWVQVPPPGPDVHAATIAAVISATPDTETGAADLEPSAVNFDDVTQRPQVDGVDLVADDAAAFDPPSPLTPQPPDNIAPGAWTEVEEPDPEGDADLLRQFLGGS